MNIQLWVPLLSLYVTYSKGVDVHLLHSALYLDRCHKGIGAAPEIHAPWEQCAACTIIYYQGRAHKCGDRLRHRIEIWDITNNKSLFQKCLQPLFLRLASNTTIDQSGPAYFKPYSKLKKLFEVFRFCSTQKLIRLLNVPRISCDRFFTNARGRVSGIFSWSTHVFSGLERILLLTGNIVWTTWGRNITSHPKEGELEVSPSPCLK